jgi:hypothetical protein
MRQRWLGNERGATLAIIAVTMFLFLGLAALAIDLGMVKAADAQAQRAADAAALAGASAFIDYANSDASIIDSAAHARVLEYALKHTIRTTHIEVNEVHDTVMLADLKVRVTITRSSVPTWFANTFGISSVGVSRQAAAVAADAGVSSNCIKPFLLPDRWKEADRVRQDSVNFGVLDASSSDGEAWFYQPDQVTSAGTKDSYVPYDPSNPSSDQTGYGSGPQGDRGLELMLKPQKGSSQRMGNFYQLLDPASYGDSVPVKDAIASGCLSARIGDTVHISKDSSDLKDGGTTSSRQGVHALFVGNDDVPWDPAGHPAATMKYPDWTQNPRVITVAFYAPVGVTCVVQGESNPSHYPQCKNTKPQGTITLQNFARIFLDRDPGDTGPPENITARFIGFIGGGAGGPAVGPTVKVLRLVE